MKLLPNELTCLCSFIRTEESHCYEAVLTINTNRRLGLTGTPIHNSLHDIVSLIAFLEGTGPHIKSPLIIKLEEGLNSGNFQQLHLLLRRSTLRRTKEKNLPSLPPLTTNIIRLGLSKDTELLYEEIFSGLSSKQFSKGNFLAQINNLRLCCDHPAMVNNTNTSSTSEGNHSELPFQSSSRSLHIITPISVKECYKSQKVQWLVSFLKSRQIHQSEKKKTVVYSQWTQFLDM